LKKVEVSAVNEHNIGGSVLESFGTHHAGKATADDDNTWFLHKWIARGMK
jgi:hypothetical protein